MEITLFPSLIKYWKVSEINVSLSSNEDEDQNKVEIKNVECDLPTKENPLMNPLIGDNATKKKVACNIDDNSLQAEYFLRFIFYYNSIKHFLIS